MNGAPSAMRPVPVVLVEPNADREGGHWHHTLSLLARAAARAGHRVIVIAPNGITDKAAAVRESGTEVWTGERLTGAAGLLFVCARVVAALSQRLLKLPGRSRLPLALRRFPHQLTVLSRCLTEAASLRAAHRASQRGGRRPVVVVLTAGEALHGMAAVLGGAVHLRIVHEVYTTEDLPLRLLGRAFRAGWRRVLVVATTPAVRDELRARFPGLPTAVATFSLTDPADHLTQAERDDARHVLGIGAEETVAVMVGGWWPGKAPAVVADALHLLAPDEVPAGGLRLIVAGHPLDERVLARMAAAPSVRLIAHNRVLPDEELRRLYAAADLALVSRTPDCRKESALVADATRLGVALLVSDHDPDLAARLAGTKWAMVFRAGDAADLAAVLRRMLTAPLDRPGPDATGTVGLTTGGQALARYIRQFEQIGDDP